jgi:SAM-dependent methyltransferase
MAEAGGIFSGRSALDDWLIEHGQSHAISLQLAEVHRRVTAAIERYARGRCLDAGSGRGPFISLLRQRGCQVVRLDQESRGAAPDILGDVQDLSALPAASFDTVLCTQVLEHVPHPRRALLELSRMLRPGGHLILSAPHLSMVHEAPLDFFRFTRFALERLAREAGLEVIELSEAGGLLAFLAHGPSLAALLGLRRLGLPLPRVLPWHRRLWVDLLRRLDERLGMPARFPCNLLLVAQKPPGGNGAAGG